MKKIIAVILCWFLALGLGFSLLPDSYNLIAGWLGPVFGTPLRILLSTVYLLFVDPIAYTTLIFIWAVVGFIGGLIIRKRIGSVLSMLPVYAGQFLIVSLSGFRIFEIIQEWEVFQQPSIENIMGFLPPIPPRVSLDSILSAPIINDFISRLPSDFSSFGLDMIVGTVLSTIVLNIIKNIVIICFSALVGCEMGKFIVRLMRERGVMERLMSRNRSTVKLQKKILKKPLLLLVLLLLAVTTSITPSGQVDGGSYYSEVIVGGVIPDGTAYTASLFLDMELSLGGISLTDSAFTGAVAALLISQETTTATLPPFLLDPAILSEILPSNFPSEVLGELTRYYDLLFPTMFIIIYIDVDAVTASQRATEAAVAFSSAFDISLKAIPMAISLEFGSHIFIYYSSDALVTTADSIMSTLQMNRGGMTGFIKTAYDSGVLIPGEHPDAANGTIMFTGFLRTSSLLEIMGEVGGDEMEALTTFIPDIENPLGVMGMVSYWLDKYHSSTFNFNFSINDLLGISEAISFSTIANISTALIVVPNATVNELGEVPLNPILKLFTTAPIVFETIETLQEIFNIEIFYYTPENVSSGVIIDPELITLAFTQLFNIDIQVEKTLSFPEIDLNEEIVVTIIITNDDTDPIKNVKLDDSLSLTFYSDSANLVEGALTKEWSEIPGGSSMSHSYKIMFSREGVYTLSPAGVSYNYTGDLFLVPSNSAYITVHSPSFFQVVATGIPYAWNLAVRGLDMIPGVGGNGKIILIGIVVVSLGSLALNEYRGFRKRKKKAEIMKIEIEPAPAPMIEFKEIEEPLSYPKPTRLNKRVEVVEGITLSYANKLKDSDIKTINDLLEAGSTRKGRREIARKTGASTKTVLRWINRADLFRIRGIGKGYSNLLDKAGITTIVDLSRRNPVNLHKKINEINMTQPLVKQIPSLKTVEEWVEQAKTLDRIVKY